MMAVVPLLPSGDAHRTLAQSMPHGAAPGSRHTDRTMLRTTRSHVAHACYPRLGPSNPIGWGGRSLAPGDRGRHLLVNQWVRSNRQSKMASPPSLPPLVAATPTTALETVMVATRRRGRKGSKKSSEDEAGPVDLSPAVAAFEAALLKRFAASGGEDGRRGEGSVSDEDDDGEVVMMSLETKDEARVRKVAEMIQARRPIRLACALDSAFRSGPRWRNARRWASHRQAAESHRMAELEAAIVVGPTLEAERKAPHPKAHKEERRKFKEHSAKYASKDWFNMPAPELTAEVKRQLDVVRLRAYTDPKRFYRNIHGDSINRKNHKYPKHFQFGTVIESKKDFYSARIAKKDRGKDLVDELLKDEKVAAYTARIVRDKSAAGMVGRYEGKRRKRKNRTKAFAERRQKRQKQGRA
ncbi:rRNA-processing protein FCF2 [Thecamonas trahens ATCC 50062]|uniref:rRNA-processing protein FCF2 n=1 Tax=Thecamonas trahens ATCC 50062 TaxID=461836 RepID=A0A0L0DJ08_THETB|nr:rRNA-processing protein FCF2 [Thecamonas trahens ATCC 50062]KNC51313.1 rRNA-processing protein FCF2 [Thecamonas trahens ATCC 50062]|eukprot:XP_013756235.1 rRNA-processing protein FCF2 [Thecamonas trahens ATCC 50062]